MLKTINFKTNLKTRNIYQYPFLIGHKFLTSTIMIIVFADLVWYSLNWLYLKSLGLAVHLCLFILPMYIYTQTGKISIFTFTHPWNNTLPIQKDRKKTYTPIDIPINTWIHYYQYILYPYTRNIPIYFFTSIKSL